MQRGNDCAVREGELPVAEGLYRNIVPQLGAQLFQVASCQMVDRDQLPVAISGRDFDAVNRSRLSIGLSGCGCHVRSCTAQRGDRCEQESDLSHPLSPSEMPD